MRPAATIGVYNNLATGQSGIAMGSTNHKLTRWIHVQFDVITKQALNRRTHCCLYPWDQNVFDIRPDLSEHGFLRIKIIVLG